MISYADVVVDLQHGDTGKGKIANALSQRNHYTHVVRFSGSNNAGHTIYHDGKKIVTHAIPCGVLHGIKSIIGSGCVVNPTHFLSELKELKQHGIDCKDKVFIARNAHVITSKHLAEDSGDIAIGTTKRGNGPAYRDKYDRKGVRAEDVPELQPFLVDLYEEFHSEERCGILFEGAQGFGLDIDWGDYPYVTSSHCTVGSAVLNAVPPQCIRGVWGVAKIYDTYVGAKRFEPEDPIFPKIRELAEEYGATTGRPRQCNWLNLKELVKAIKINGVDRLVFNKNDILRKLDTWKLYDTEGKLREFQSEFKMRQYLMDALPQELLDIRFSDNPNGF